MAAEELDHSKLESYDRIARDLQQLRCSAGDVSYAEIVRRIGKQRESDGVSPASARPGRTTVYDAFREGRSRINTNLVCEIAQALGAGESEVANWRTRCNEARTQSAMSRKAEPSMVESEAAQAPVHTGMASDWWKRHVNLAHLLVVAAGIAINFLGYSAAVAFGLPLFMDAIGTGLVAIALGPWWGVAVGIGTNLVEYSVHGTLAIPFTLQSVLFALMWGYGARRFRMTRTLGSYFRLNILVGLSHMFISLPIVMFMFHGSTGAPRDAVLHKLTDFGIPFALSVVLGQLMLALSDVLLAGFVILVVMSFLKTWPPFQDSCAGLFPFLVVTGSPATSVRRVAARRKAASSLQPCSHLGLGS